MTDQETNNRIKVVTMNNISRKDFFKVYLAKLFAGSKLNLTHRDLELLALTKLNMNKFDAAKFAKMLNASSPNINNYKSKLIKCGCLIKTSDGYGLNPELNIDYSDRISMVFNLEAEKHSESING